MTCVRTTALLLLSVCSADNTITNTEYRKQYERSLASKTYCPPDKSGRVPTEACNGFVECIKGIQGNNRFDCAPGTIFDVAEDTCNWPDAVTDCSPFIAYADGQATDAYVNSTNNYCPPEYTGRAPTSRCVGYVVCIGGERTSGAKCPYKTTFDSKTQMCVDDNMKECNLLVEVTDEMIEEMSEEMGEEMIQMDAETEELERIVFPRDCHGEFTGKAAINDCAGYIECDKGVEAARYNCTKGTLFDRTIGLCNWDGSVICESSSPSMKPTPAPSTAAPTPWDPNNVYYPKFSDGVCVNDGKQPEDVDPKFLFSDIDVCCKTYFEKSEDCSKVTSPPTNAPTKWRPKVWYPDYVNKMCKKDGKHGIYEQNFFGSYDACCKFDFMDEVKCMENKPAMYYANYDTNTCTSDGNPSSYEDMLFLTHQECCQYDWIDTETCTFSGDMLVQNSAAAGAATVVEVKFYPDFLNNKCKCDGKQPNSVETFSTYEKCCDYEWLNNNECMKHIQECSTAPAPTPSEGLWYPEKNSNRCKNDGNNPDGVLVFTSYQVCCFRTMPDVSKQCESNSQASMMTT